MTCLRNDLKDFKTVLFNFCWSFTVFYSSKWLYTCLGGTGLFLYFTKKNIGNQDTFYNERFPQWRYINLLMRIFLKENYYDIKDTLINIWKNSNIHSFGYLSWNKISLIPRPNIYRLEIMLCFHLFQRHFIYIINTIEWNFTFLFGSAHTVLSAIETKKKINRKYIFYRTRKHLDIWSFKDECVFFFFHRLWAYLHLGIYINESELMY